MDAEPPPTSGEPYPVSPPLVGEQEPGNFKKQEQFDLAVCSDWWLLCDFQILVDLGSYGRFGDPDKGENPAPTRDELEELLSETEQDAGWPVEFL